MAVPLPTPRRVPSSKGVDLAAYDLGGDGPPLLLAHATGFCGAVLAPLADRLPHRSVTFDERGHGRSGRPVDGDFDWHGFADDVLAVVDALGLERPFGFGHSCGGAALLLAEQARPGTFAGLYLFEPVVLPGEPVPPNPDNPLAAGARRRRARFASRAAAQANYAGKPPLDVLHPECLEAYVVHGFAEEPDGSVVLRCRPDDEAAVFSLGFSHDAYRRLPEVACPVTLACGARTDAFGPDHMANLAQRLPDARVVVLEGLDHFGPLEDPAAVASSMEAAVAATG